MDFLAVCFGDKPAQAISFKYMECSRCGLESYMAASSCRSSGNRFLPRGVVEAEFVDGAS